ncbi:MAG: glycoside hydrolase family 95-like protein [bacterium]
MLLQSHDGTLHLLPALPRAWADGAFRGLRARGGVEVDVSWQGGKARSAVLRAAIGGTHRLRAPAGQVIDSVTRDGASVVIRRDGEVAVVEVAASGAYVISFR